MAENDSELAFNLQVEEALTASLLDDAAPTPEAASVSYNAVFGPTLSGVLQEDHLHKYEEELLGQYKAVAEAKRIRVDLSRQSHDHALASEIANVPEADWQKTGDHVNRPYVEGSSSPGNNNRSSNFRVYVKGLLEEKVGGIGVAICDGSDGLLFEQSKGFSSHEGQVNQELVEFKALSEGLDVAVVLDLKRVCVITDSPGLYRYITGKNPPATANANSFCQHINILLRKFTYTSASFVARKDIKFAVELAQNAIAHHFKHSAGSSSAKKFTERCAICFEDTSADQMFTIADCLHRYCFPCMSKHVQFKLLEGVLPKCPFENCKSELKLDSCKRFLTHELFEVLSQRVREASIPIADKMYCPYLKCSALLSKAELRRSTGGTECPKCRGFFCINCKVPWHKNMSCFDFKRLNPHPGRDDKKLKIMATHNLWRQCPKCSFMVSLAEGCYHIYCRCGHEFCYKCGAEWKKKPTCTCPIWDEHNIIRN